MKSVKRPLCVLIGGGGHAVVIIDTLELTGMVQLHGILDRNSAVWGSDVLGVPILGGDELLVELADAGVEYFVIGLGSTGDNFPRKRLYEQAIACRLKPFTVIHPTAFVSKRAKVGVGAQLCPGSIVNAQAALGVNVIVNTGAIVEHGCILGDHVHVATGARLASTVTVDTCAHIGAGATVRQCVSIGEGAVVGAGAGVIGDVPPFQVVAGVPAKPLQASG